MKSPLLNLTMQDGTRHFAELPETCGWEQFRQHIALLPVATVTGFLTDHVTEMWLDFSFQGHAFSVNNQHGNFWFFVRDPACPDEVLTTIVEHCEPLLFE